MGAGQSTTCVGDGGRPGHINSLYGTCEVDWNSRTECEKSNTCNVKRADGTSSLIPDTVPIPADSHACLIAMSFFAGVLLTSAVTVVYVLAKQRQRNARVMYLPVEQVEQGKGDF